MSQTNEPSNRVEQRDRQRQRNLWLIAGLAGALGLAALCLMAVLAGGLLLLGDRGRATQAQVAPAGGAVQVAPAADSTGGGRPASKSLDRIAFVNPQGQLGTVAAAGADGRLLTAPGMRYQFPAWSPDGTRLATIGVGEQQAGVYVVADRAGDGPEPLELYNDAWQAPIYLYWSPDGRNVAFLANENRSLALHLAPADGSGAEQVLATGQPFYWDWAGGGDRLLIHTGGLGESARLAFVSTQGKVLDDDLASPGLFQAPGVSPSGQYLAFAATEDDQFQVVAQDTRSDERVQVPHAGLAALSWSPVDEQLAFIAPQVQAMAFFGPLRLLDAASGDVRTLTNEVVLAFFWSPDGRSIAYLTLEGNRNTPGAMAPSPPETGAGFEAIANRPQQHRDVLLRLSVVDVEGGRRRPLTTFRPTDIFVTQFLPFFDQYALSHRLWSPDSTALVMPMLDQAGQDGVFVVPVDGGEPRQVAEGSIGFWSRQ
jgi:TolB protein